MPADATHVQPGIGAVDRVEGPLKGNHHLTFAIRLDPGPGLAQDFRWLKLREPREGVLWYDMRWFPSEGVVLRLLREHSGDIVRRIPRVCETSLGEQPPPVLLALIEFIEGATLDRVRGSHPGRVDERFLQQIADLFAALTAVDADRLVDFGSPAVPGCADCDLAAYPECGGSTQFLSRLKHFTFSHAYDQQRQDMDDLLTDLGVPPATLEEFAVRRPELTDRPRKLLHGDLHRKNFVVDRVGTLWTFDWELALVGDPLYDLATHLHLMEYAVDQEADLIDRWERAVGVDAAAGAREDLPHYRAFKRVQSLCTDVLRTTARLTDAGEVDGRDARRHSRGKVRPSARRGPTQDRVRAAAAVVRGVLEAARPHLELDRTLPLPAVELALEAFLQRTALSRAPREERWVPRQGEGT